MTAAAPVSTAGVISGLSAEIELLRKTAQDHTVDDAMLCATGGNCERVRDAARRMAEQGAKGLVSFGLAGGLDPAHAPGALLLPAFVVGPAGQAFAVDTGWRGQLGQALAGLDPQTVDRIAGVDRPATTPANKSELQTVSCGAAVDMESHVVAEVAAEARLPFVVLRAVADPASRVVPRAALAGLGADGATAVWPVLAGLARRPGEISGLIALAFDARKAMAVLRRAAAAAGPVLFRL